MKRNKHLWAVVLASSLATASFAQWQGSTPGRLGIGLQQKVAEAQSTAVRGVGEERVAVMITAENASSAALLLNSYGYAATVVGERLVSAAIPVSALESTLDLPGILKVEAPRRFRPLMDAARASANVDAVHKGVGFDTPYTGKGVLVGVIDEGFDYAHAALRDNTGQTRAKLVREYTTTNGKMTTAYSYTDHSAIIAKKHDTYDETHATHVTGIAAGTRLVKNGTDLTPYYGLAYNADLALIASTFADDEILDGVKTIKELAKKNDQPWVINMSFGSQMGPHDGSTEYDKELSSYVGAGGFVVAAMGNEGEDRLHLGHTFATVGDTLNAVIIPAVDDNGSPEEDQLPITLWLNKGTNYNDLSIRLRLYDTENDVFIKAADVSSYWDTRAEVYVDSATNNGKTNVVINVLNNKLFTRSYKDASRYMPLLEVVAKRAGAGFHGWIEANLGQWWNGDNDTYHNGDSHYQVAEGAASSEKVVAVGAYTTKTSWTTLDGTDESYTYSGPVDSLSTYSCVGPQLDNNLPKPTIVAPGTLIASAISSTHKTFKKSELEAEWTTVAKTSANSRDNYYGMSQGTSMATPMVTGAIALWLEAYPTMPYATLMDILKRSAKHDDYTGHDEWNPTWGYGKLNVYEGLKLALEAKKNEATGIYHVANTAAPITCLIEAKRCKLLFGSHERTADIRLYTTAGAMVYSQQLRQVSLGHEEVVELSTLPKGVYLLQVKTAGANYQRKVVVE